MTELSPFPINAETIAALREAIGTSVTLDAEGNRGKVGGEFTLYELLDFYSGSDRSRSTLISGESDGPPVHEMWDAQYAVTDVIAALLDAVSPAITGGGES